MKDSIKIISAYLFGLAIFCLILWGGYWIAKTVSYRLFYKEMVEQTVIELVKPDSLKGR
jgi:hypothetical protein